MIADKIAFYNSLFKILLIIGILLLVSSLMFFYKTDLKVFFFSKLSKRKSKSSKRSKAKRNKNVYTSENLKEIDYDKSHEIKDPSERLENMTGALNDNTDEIDDYGSESTGSLKIEDEEGEDETGLLDDYIKNNIEEDNDGDNETELLDINKSNSLNIKKIDYEDIPCNSDFYEDMIDRNYFNDDAPIYTGTKLMEDNGEDETSILTSKDKIYNKDITNNRLWSNGLTQFEIIEKDCAIIVNSDNSI